MIIYPQVNQASVPYMEVRSIEPNSHIDRVSNSFDIDAFILKCFRPLLCHQAYESLVHFLTLDQCTSPFNITIVRIVTFACALLKAMQPN